MEYSEQGYDLCFLHFNTLCLRAANALVRLRICTGLYKFFYKYKRSLTGLFVFFPTRKIDFEF